MCDVHHDSPIEILEEDLIKHRFWPECFTDDYYKPYTTTVNNIQGDKGNVTKEDTNEGLNNIANFIFLHKSDALLANKNREFTLQNIIIGHSQHLIQYIGINFVLSTLHIHSKKKIHYIMGQQNASI